AAVIEPEPVEDVVGMQRLTRDLEHGADGQVLLGWRALLTGKLLLFDQLRLEVIDRGRRVVRSGLTSPGSQEDRCGAHQRQPFQARANRVKGTHGALPPGPWLRNGGPRRWDLLAAGSGANLCDSLLPVPARHKRVTGNSDNPFGIGVRKSVGKER